MMAALKKSLEKTAQGRKAPLHTGRETSHEKRTRRKAS